MITKFVILNSLIYNILVASPLYYIYTKINDYYVTFNYIISAQGNINCLSYRGNSIPSLGQSVALAFEDLW